ncbi:MAG: 4-hydroxy-tetrahydrodipicolinate reductase [Verrucomicrobiota bacterium]
MKTKIVVIGSKGRMGIAIIRLLGLDPEAEVVGAIDEGDDLDEVLPGCDAVIDFSHHSVSLEVARKTTEQSKALVIGTTGHATEVKERVLALGQKVPMIFAPNYSVGVNTLFYITRKTAEILSRGFDQEIVEMHHHFKKDSPSGTAAKLLEILCDVKGKSVDELARYGREGEPGARTKNEIGVHALRGGDVVGDHTVIFAATGERVELTHKASSRDTFAGGAIRAAKFLQGKPPGVYDMFDVLGLK